MFSEPPVSAASVRRLWWAFLLATLGLELLSFLLARAPFRGGSGPWALILWLPFGLHLAARLVLVGALWPSLKEGGRVQLLLASQAAIPVFCLALNHFLLPFLAAQGVFDLARGYPLLLLLSLVAEMGALGTAFWLRPHEPEEGDLGVAAAAGLAVLGQGWIAVGLMPLLARLMKDPLLSELCGADADPERGAFLASLTGFLLLFSAPFLMGLDLMHGAWMNVRLWLLGPSLLVGAVVWCRFGSSLGTSGKVWRVLTWVLLGLLPALALAGLFLLLALSGHWH